MTCGYFGLCGSCTLYDMPYEKQLSTKVEHALALLDGLQLPKHEVFSSDESAFRHRVEFKIYRTGERVSFAMRALQGSGFVPIDSCGIVSGGIAELMPKTIEALNSSDLLRSRLFEAHFLDGKKPLLTLIYHKKLDEEWRGEAQKLSEKLGISVAGRSKGKKYVFGDEFVKVDLSVGSRTLRYALAENGFSQPNKKLNEAMLKWSIEGCADVRGDLLEAYCGGGNFTVALAPFFGKVLATEVSSVTIELARRNAVDNGVDNIAFARLSGEELSEALDRKRAFFRLKQIDLDSYDFTTLFVDPPRAGLDETMLGMAKSFERIIYISCSPETLSRDLNSLKQTHKIERLAFFDQFAYTRHLESGVVLTRRE